MMGTHCTGIFRRAEILSTGLSQRKNVARSPLIPMTEFLVDNTEFHFQGCLLGLTIRAFSTAGRMGKPVFPCPRFSLPLFHSHIYFFFSASRFPSSIQSRAICPQSTFFIFYATLSFKAFCSWLATELLPISSESSPSSCAHRSSSQSSPSVPEAARLGVHLGVCLSGCGSPQGFQLPGA